ncbi:MAG: 50S ribosomal protein L1 [Planctomycetota bacterium]
MSEETTTKKRARSSQRRPGKRTKAARANVPDQPVPLAAAIELVKGFQGPKFDQSVELIFNLGVDVKQADQMVRSSISLPHGIGKSNRVVAFVDESNKQAALEAGAIMAGGEDMVGEMEKANFTDFDVAVAEPSMMRHVGKLGKVLGPKGLMPSPKAGTVTADPVTAIKEYAAGKQEFRADAGGNVHTLIGKASFDTPKLVENAEALIAEVKRLKPESSKGVYMKKAVVKATMTPAVELQVS